MNGHEKWINKEKVVYRVGEEEERERKEREKAENEEYQKLISTEEISVNELYLKGLVNRFLSRYGAKVR